MVSLYHFYPDTNMFSKAEDNLTCYSSEKCFGNLRVYVSFVDFICKSLHSPSNIKDYLCCKIQIVTAVEHLSL